MSWSIRWQNGQNNFVAQAWLFIDTHAPGRCRLGWLSLDEPISVRTYRGRPPCLLRRLFVHERERLQACVGICVVAGPGSFSAIRTGVLYANLLARLVARPLVGVTLEDAVSLKQLARNLALHALSSVSYVAPVYDREPNITVPRNV